MITKLILQPVGSDELFTFIFPNGLNKVVVLDHVKYIRFGHHNWERKLRDHTLMPIVLTEDFAGMEKDHEMKYIVHGNEKTGQECMIVFSKNIDHDRANEMLMDMHFGGDASDEIDINRPISAGFIYSTGKCHGRSESMNMESREQDTVLVKNGMLKL